MQPIFYVIAIMGCGDGSQVCQQQRVEPIHYVTAAACQAAMPAALERNTDIDAPEIQAAFNQTATEFNQILPDGIATTFRTVSIVELGFAGNVLREIYRISLEDGSALNVATGQKAAR